MLLPHGIEGQGPEHSSAYPERYLKLCADDNIQVCNATTPAQYFHLLRRQVKRNFRVPLILMTPKSLLRHEKAVSTLADLKTGSFSEILCDPCDPKFVKRVLLCCGKIYYDLLAHRETLDTDR
ncbi:MAG: 2-oxoglutarate dehydrogenase E1 component, partial [Planctomycetota bacterium]